MNLGELTLEDAAKAAAGNWKKFECFAWHRARELHDSDNWTVIYTHHRDSGLLDQSNAAAIEAELDTFTTGSNPEVVAEHHHHWAVGWIDGFSIRVFREGRITKSFRTYHALTQRMADYPVLDDDDYARRDFEDTLSNLTDAAWRLKTEFDLPEDWEPVVYDWFTENDYSAVENRDDRGGYPSESQLRAAFLALRFGEETPRGT